jgi:hypothetical protein
MALHKAEVALGTMGIGLDWGGFGYDLIPAAEIAEIVRAFPRLKTKHRFSETCRHLVETRPETTYDKVLRDFGDRFVPSYRPISTVDLLMNAPFGELRNSSVARRHSPRGRYSDTTSGASVAEDRTPLIVSLGSHCDMAECPH